MNVCSLVQFWCAEKMNIPVVPRVPTDQNHCFMVTFNNFYVKSLYLRNKYAGRNTKQPPTIIILMRL
jgi:hypothetical protein